MMVFDVMYIVCERGDYDRFIGSIKFCEILIIELMYGVGYEDKFLKVEIFNLESDNSS